MEDRSRRTKVSPQRDEHYRRQSERDSASKVKDDGKDIELNGETDDENMGDGEMTGAHE